MIRDADGLAAKLAECDRALREGGDDALRAVFDTFRFDAATTVPADPFSPAYLDHQMALHRSITGRSYSLDSERTRFDVARYAQCPFPFSTGSTTTTGHHLAAIGFVLRAMALPSGARVLEFGPGYGNTTLALAQLGVQVTAVDVEPNYCEVIRRRARALDVVVEVVEADFFWAEQVTEPFDAILFFECFHHCADHMRLLHALRRAVRPEGRVYFGAEPISLSSETPWGLRFDGEALWAMRNFGWLELGFRESYFRAALRRAGFMADKRESLDQNWISVWTARPAPPDPDAVETRLPEPPPDPPGTAVVAQLERELAAMHRSTSWRVTAPLRRLARLLG